MLRTYFLGILFFVGSGYALYDSHSDVVELTPDNFNRLVTDSYEVWLVEFYAPWCGHCKNLVPEYKKAAKALRGIAKVGAMDADQYKSFGKSYGVSGFPTIKIFTGSKHVPYKSSRTADGLVEAVLKAVKSKAYERLGKRPEDSGSDKPPGIYGHYIPWEFKTSTLKTTQSPPTSEQPLINTTETCAPDSNKTEETQHTTAKIIARMKDLKLTVNMESTMKTPVNTSVTKKTTTKTPVKTSVTKKTTIKSPVKTSVTMKTTTKAVKTTPITTYDRFKKLQMLLLRGDIKEETRAKIMKTLMRLKFVLQKKGVVNANATISKRRSDKRQGRGLRSKGPPIGLRTKSPGLGLRRKGQGVGLKTKRPGLGLKSKGR